MKKVRLEWIVCLLLLFPLMFGTLNELLGLPGMIKYILDVVWCVLLLQMLWCRRSIDFKGSKVLMLWIAAFAGYTLLAYLMNFQSPLYYLWGLRNNFRVYAAFFAFAVFVTCDQVENLFKILDCVFWINFAVSLVQCIGFGVMQDYLGGIFGVQSGVNGYTNIFMLIVTLRSLLLYLNGKEKAWVCAAKCLAALIISTLAELKFFNIAFMIIAAMAVFFSGINKKNLIVLALCCAASLISAEIIGKLFPYFDKWYKVDAMWETVTTEYGYTYMRDINRLTAIPTINQFWLKDLMKQLFGLGLGNCDTSSFAFLNIVGMFSRK